MVRKTSFSAPKTYPIGKTVFSTNLYKQAIDEKTTFFEFGVYAAWKMYKNYGSIPKGNVLIIGKHIPADLRYYELNQVLYKAYGTASWWVIPYHPAASNEPEDPPPLILSDERRLIQYVSSDYEYECRFLFIYFELKLINSSKK